MEELTASEQATIAYLVNHPSYKAFTKVMEQEVLRFREDLINTPTNEAAKVLAAHQMAKASAMFYARVKARLEREAQLTTLDVVNEGFEDISSELLGEVMEETFRDGE